MLKRCRLPNRNHRVAASYLPAGINHSYCFHTMCVYTRCLHFNAWSCWMRIAELLPSILAITIFAKAKRCVNAITHALCIHTSIWMRNCESTINNTIKTFQFRSMQTIGSGIYRQVYRTKCFELNYQVLKFFCLFLRFIVCITLVSAM